MGKRMFMLLLFKSLSYYPTRLFCQWDSPGKNTGSGCHALLQGTFSTQGVNPHLLCLTALAGRVFTTITTWEARECLWIRWIKNIKKKKASHKMLQVDEMDHIKIKNFSLLKKWKWQERIPRQSSCWDLALSLLWVRSLVRELRSHKPCGLSQKNKKMNFEKVNHRVGGKKQNI